MLANDHIIQKKKEKKDVGSTKTLKFKWAVCLRSKRGTQNQISSGLRSFRVYNTKSLSHWPVVQYIPK